MALHFVLSTCEQDADGGRARAEARAQELENELKKLRADAERSLRAKDEEIVEIRKKLMAEIDSLTMRLQESESRYVS